MNDLTALLLTREIELHLATANLGAAMLRVWDWADEDAMVELDPYVAAEDAARAKVASVKELIGFMTPSSYARNYR